ncbi:MAG: hypothetical protein H7306_26090 [Bacteriovorax sp.]|nr:hypothetical protein [Rhizobacter sp.]
MRSVDFRYGDARQPGEPATRWPEAGPGWNVDGRWYTEGLASCITSSEHGRGPGTPNWQNDLLPTQGQCPFDLALHTPPVKAKSAWGADAVEFAAVFQTEIDRTQRNANLIFERSFGANATEPTPLKYPWQLRQRWRPWLHFGAQGCGELGPREHWSARDSQSHRPGTALFGTLPPDGQAGSRWVGKPRTASVRPMGSTAKCSRPA